MFNPTKLIDALEVGDVLQNNESYKLYKVIEVNVGDVKVETAYPSNGEKVHRMTIISERLQSWRWKHYRSQKRERAERASDKDLVVRLTEERDAITARRESLSKALEGAKATACYNISRRALDRLDEAVVIINEALERAERGF